MRKQYEDDRYVGGAGGRVGWRRRWGARISTWTGAGLALLVVGGVVLWGYRLGQREATAVPVIRAALEPAKVQPREPAGAETEPKDIRSYSADKGSAAPTEITFAPPPERPAQEDVAMGTLQPTATDTGVPAALPAPVETQPAQPDGATAGDGTEQAPEASPLVQRRPGDLSARMAAARRAVSEEDELASRAAASQVQIQLGAFPDREVVKSEWARIYRANEDILQGRALVMQSTISGGRRFFRLRAGPFKDRIEAQNVCRALQARGQVCLVAVNG